MMVKLKRSECVVLPLVLKHRWFDMIEAGVKYEEYRTAPGVLRMIQRWWGCAKIECKAAVIEFRRGYAKGAKRMLQICDYVSFRRAGDFINAAHGEPVNLDHYAMLLAGNVEVVDELERESE